MREPRQERPPAARSSSCSPPRRSSSTAAPAALARRRPLRPPPPRPPSISAARCSCSPSIRRGGWPTRSGSSSSATSRRACRPRRSPSAGVEPRGELWAAMLDTKQSWDDLIRRHAPDAQTRDAILANPLYQNLMGRFVQSHDYIAMERLYDIHTSGTYDLIVVDTPPTRNAIDFLEAPAAHGRLLLQPVPALAHRSRPVARHELSRRSPSTRSPTASSGRSSSRTSRSSSCCSSRCTAASSSVRTPSRACSATGARRSSWCRRSSRRPSAKREYFISELRGRELHLGAVVLNKVLPGYLLDREATAGRAAHVRGSRRARRQARRRPATPRRSSECCGRSATAS